METRTGFSGVGGVGGVGGIDGIGGIGWCPGKTSGLPECGYQISW